MDTDFLKETLGVIAQHGPWAVLSFFLSYCIIKEGRLNREAHVRNTEVLARLTALIEGLDHKDRP